MPPNCAGTHLTGCGVIANGFRDLTEKTSVFTNFINYLDILTCLEPSYSK